MTIDQDAMEAQGFARFDFEGEVAIDGHSTTVSRRVFHAGEGPCLLLMHELPGLSQPCVDLAKRLTARGFHVFMPHLVGPVLREQSLRNLARLCISREFAHLRSGTAAPIASWLRLLARRIAGGQGQSRIGAIGMCLTGAFVIPLLIEPGIAAAVASQPGIPFSLVHALLGPRMGRGDWERRVNVSDAELDEAARCVRAATKTIMIQRFAEDRICPAARVERLAQAFFPRAEVYTGEPTSPRRPTLRSPPHAMLTEEFDRAHRNGTVPLDDPTERALSRLVEFFNLHLGERQVSEGVLPEISPARATVALRDDA